MTAYRAVWRSAHQLVLEHCDNAALHAAINADRALAERRLDSFGEMSLIRSKIWGAV